MVSSVSIALLMPHAPVLVPAVAGDRAKQVADTTAAMREAARRVLAHRPEVLVLISPHSPRRSQSFGIWSGAAHVGSLAQFQAPNARIDLPNAVTLNAQLQRSAITHELALWEIGNTPLDHGVVVPLWFLCEAGWKGPTTILSLNHPGEGNLQELGRALAEAADSCGVRMALIASGDMSHRLKPGAPGGYDSEAQRFDEEFIDLIDEGDASGLCHFDPELEAIAGEDALDSTLVALGAVQNDMEGHEVLSYEGPFGVGYGVAVLHEMEPVEQGRLSLPEIARRSVASALGMEEPVIPQPDSEFLRIAAPIFVTVRKRDGELRGCIGSVVARESNIVVETWNNARAAAFDDGRFRPVRHDELDDLVFEVSLLHDFENVSDASQLDAHRFGVIVSTNDGRRGLLLPDVDGIDTVEQQLSVARRKGRIEPDEPVTLKRFVADKFEEQAVPSS